MKKYVMHDHVWLTGHKAPIYGGPRLQIEALLSSEMDALSTLQEVRENVALVDDSMLLNEIECRERFVQGLRELQQKLLDN